MAQPLLTIAQARQRVLAAVGSPFLDAVESLPDHATELRPVETVPVPQSLGGAVETVPVPESLGRVLAQDVLAAADTPPFACSAMDGYAIEAGPPQRELELIGESRAGAPSAGALAPGRAIRISTGAAVPQGAGAVIRQEDVERRDGTIVTRVHTGTGDNIRCAGEDMRAGARVLARGRRLGPAEIGAAVAAGAGELMVFRRPRVAVLCTGDELREPGARLAAGEIHNSNGPMLLALASEAGAQAISARVLSDDRAATTAALEGAVHEAEVLVISGGVSVGPHDHVKPALAQLGVHEHFWGVALAPGKPTWFGALGSTLVFGLPGNPVSAYVTFILFAVPALAALEGASAHPPSRMARLGVPVKRKLQREQALRVRLLEQEGELVAVPNGPQGSHMVSSLVGADALALIPAGEEELATGEWVPTVALRP